jgi:ubiquinone/menaquinone biosynthesis C-methylase UbiE
MMPIAVHASWPPRVQTAWPATPFVSALIEKASLTAGTSILDVACGTGYVARAALAVVGPSGRVAALDVNGQRVAYARTLTAGSAPAIEWHEASAEDMPFKDGEFDAVLCQQGLQHFPQLSRAVAEMARVAGPGARIVGSVWSPLER